MPWTQNKRAVDKLLFLFVIFMPIVMKRDRIIVIRINARSDNDRSAQVMPDILDDLIRIAFIRHSSDIEPTFAIHIDGGFYFFKGIA